MTGCCWRNHHLCTSCCSKPSNRRDPGWRAKCHALLGENGAGKSTLMKILCGVYQPDSGEIHLDGERSDIHGPHQAQQRGISIVHQELSLFPNLSVADNVFVGSQPVHGITQFIDRAGAHRAAREILDTFDLQIDPAHPVRTLSVAQQQVIEIAKALSLNARILILDEPTSALPVSCLPSANWAPARRRQHCVFLSDEDLLIGVAHLHSYELTSTWKLVSPRNRHVPPPVPSSRAL